MTPDNQDDYAELVSDEPLLTQPELQERTADISYDDEDVIVFYSSGDEPKRIPYSKKDQERFIDAIGTTFEVIGLDADDVVMNLGAPIETHHQSGWGMKHGAETVGATVINDSITDFASDAARDRWEDVTVIASLPRMIHSLGKQIADDYGDLKQLFPSVNTAIASGDSFPQRLRDTVKDQWGMDTARSFYAATEMGVVAGEDREDGMVLTNDNLYIELLDPEADMDEETCRVPEDAITPVYDVDEPVTGTALFSAPDRELLPFIRYRAGDMLTATPTGKGPRLTFEGREDRVINLSGAMVYPREIENAVQSYRDGAEWTAIVSEEDDYPVLHLYISGETEEDIVPYLAAENNSIRTWYESGGIKIRQDGYTSESELEAYLDGYDLDVNLLEDERKSKRIGFDTAYTEE